MYLKTFQIKISRNLQKKKTFTETGTGIWSETLLLVFLRCQNKTKRENIKKVRVTLKCTKLAKLLSFQFPVFLYICPSTCCIYLSIWHRKVIVKISQSFSPIQIQRSSRMIFAKWLWHFLNNIWSENILIIR